MLAAIRCLSVAGFDVTAVGSARAAPGLWSKTPTARRLAPDPRRCVEGFIAKLETIVREAHHDVVLLGTDASLLAVSRHRDRLTPYVHLGLPSQEVVERALNKECLAEEAARVGLTPPETHVCAGPTDGLVAARSLGYPVAVKPVHTVIERNGSAHRRGSVMVRDAAALEAATRTLGRFIVQRQAHGEVISFGGVAVKGGLRASAVSRYARMWPAAGGNVSFSETISCPPGLEERVEALVRRIGWEGVFELELIEAENGTLAAIDFNPRPYGSLSLAASAGVPLSAIWCGWLLGEEPKPATARVGARYRWEDADLRHFLSRLRNDWPRRSAFTGLKFRSDVTHAYFQARDPAPLIARGVQLVQRLPARLAS